MLTETGKQLSVVSFSPEQVVNVLLLSRWKGTTLFPSPQLCTQGPASSSHPPGLLRQRWQELGASAAQVFPGGLREELKVTGNGHLGEKLSYGLALWVWCLFPKDGSAAFGVQSWLCCPATAWKGRLQSRREGWNSPSGKGCWAQGPPWGRALRQSRADDNAGTSFPASKAGPKSGHLELFPVGSCNSVKLP